MQPQHTKDTIETLLRHLGVVFDEVRIVEETTGTRFVIETSEASLLIGNDGETLSALYHIVKKITVRQLEAPFDKRMGFFIDIGNYQDKTTSDIKNKVKILAERARTFKTSVELDPMSSYERMIVHSLLAEDKELTTGSQGEGKKRKVVIKYIGSDDEFGSL